MREQLIKKLKDAGVYKKGNFILKSGKSSSFYVDLRKTYGHPDILKLMKDTLIKLILRLEEKPNVIACSGLGGIPLTTLVSQELNLALTIVREKEKNHGLFNSVEGYVPNKEDKILIIDDIFTAGTSIKQTISGLEQTSAKILGACVVIDREETQPEFTLDSVLKLRDLIEND